MTEFVPVPTGHIPGIWQEVRAMIIAAAERTGRDTEKSVFESLCLGNSQLWLAWDDGPEALAITEMHQFPRRKVLRIVMMTGAHREKWLGFLAIIEDWARNQGCDVVEPIARPGWKRILAPLGYRMSHVMLTKALT
jgi:hypothetical protein